MRRVAIAFVLLALVSCSSDDKKQTPTAAGSFADATCVDFANWASAIQGGFTDLQGIDQLDVNDRQQMATVVTRLKTSLARADDASTELERGLTSRPAPAIASGQQILTSFVNALEDVHSVITSTRSKVDTYDPQTATTDQATALKAALASVQDDVVAKLLPFSALTDNEQLRQAFEGSDTCKNEASRLSAGAPDSS